jgi:phytol kinase
MNPLVGWLGIPLALGGLLAGLAMLARRTRLHPEVIRKLLHVGMGLVTLPLPWIFSSPGPVFALTALSMAGLFAVARIPALRAQLGGVLGGVGRSSLGEFAFPLGVCVVFWLARGDKTLFVAPVLVLTLADAAAAVTGIFFGRRKVHLPDGTKSLEGSAAFFLVAVVCVLGPLVVMGRAPGVESLLVGLAAAMVLMLLELVAANGFDNLLIPLAAWAQLRALGTGGRVLVLLLGLAAAAVVLVLLEKRRARQRSAFPQVQQTVRRRAVR